MNEHCSFRYSQRRLAWLVISLIPALLWSLFFSHLPEMGKSESLHILWYMYIYVLYWVQVSRSWQKEAAGVMQASFQMIPDGSNGPTSGHLQPVMPQGKRNQEETKCWMAERRNRRERRRNSPANAKVKEEGAEKLSYKIEEKFL